MKRAPSARKTGLTFFRFRKLAPPDLPEDQVGVCLLGVPFDLGSKVKGSRRGPGRIRKASNRLAFRCKDAPAFYSVEDRQLFVGDESVVDLGDVAVKGKRNPYHQVKMVVQSIPPGWVPVCVGGDHSLTLAILLGRVAPSERFTFVHIDQHFDLQVWGDFHRGKPRQLTWPTHANVVSHILQSFPLARLRQFGVQDFDPVRVESAQQARELVRYLNSAAQRVSDIELTSKSRQEVLEILPKGERVYLSVDVDVLPRYTVGDTGYSAAIGIPLHRLLDVVAGIIRHNEILGIDMMEFGSAGTQSRHGGSEIAAHLLLRLVSLVRESQMAPRPKAGRSAP